jgi:signal transduction histidine kinase
MNAAALRLLSLLPGAPATQARMAPTELAFLRFVAGIRALLAMLIGVVILTDPDPDWRPQVALVLPYLIWSAVLLWATMQGQPRAASRVWLWIDVAVLLVASQLKLATMPLFGITTVMPVIALAVLGGVVPAMALATTCAAAMVLWSGAFGGTDPARPAGLMSLIVPIAVLAFGATAALLTHPSCALRQRLKLMDTLNAQSDPRQGLRHQVDTLLGQLAAHFNLRVATLALQGPEPRIFQRQHDGQARELIGSERDRWAGLMEQLPRRSGYRCSVAGDRALSVLALDTSTGKSKAIAGDGPWRDLAQFGRHILTMPVVSYGQPFGTLCLHRDEAEFTADHLHWLGDVMHEIMPLLERSDLLEQLQRETASRERERIGRDLHDSAIQPYLGLKYGLEALARQAGPNNPVRDRIDQLVNMANSELGILRDVVSGLRNGADNTDRDGSPLAALQRQVLRFQVLYGLRVELIAANAPRLRGAAAKAVLHMVNEALTNVRRHSAATEVVIQLDANHTDLVLRLRNNVGPGNTAPKSFVPRSLYERAAEFGGSVEVRHALDGTELKITLPLMGAIA